MACRGYKGIVKSATATHVRMELEAQYKTVNIQRAHLSSGDAGPAAGGQSFLHSSAALLGRHIVPACTPQLPVSHERFLQSPCCHKLPRAACAIHSAPGRCSGCSWHASLLYTACRLAWEGTLCFKACGRCSWGTALILLVMHVTQSWLCGAFCPCCALPSSLPAGDVWHPRLAVWSVLHVSSWCTALTMLCTANC